LGITDVDKGDFVAYRSVDFGELETMGFFSALISTQKYDNFILVHRDALDGPVIAVLPLLPTGTDFHQFFAERTPLVATLAGQHDIFLEFGSGASSSGLDIGRF